MKIKQGIDGYVYQVSGNQMPSPNAPPSKPHPLATTVFIYEITNLKDVARVGYSPFYQSIRSKLVATTPSDSTGHFTISLPVGAYSVFTKKDNLFYANIFDTENNIQPVSVEENKITKINIRVDAGATY